MMKIQQIIYDTSGNEFRKWAAPIFLLWIERWQKSVSCVRFVFMPATIKRAWCIILSKVSRPIFAHSVKHTSGCMEKRLTRRGDNDFIDRHCCDISGCVFQNFSSSNSIRKIGLGYCCPLETVRTRFLPCLVFRCFIGTLLTKVPYKILFLEKRE